MAKITFDDKYDLNVQSDIPDVNKITADDMNKIKEAINDNYEEIQKLINSGGSGGDEVDPIASMPLGTITEWFSASYPDNFLPIDGQAISRITYADLFALIGTTYGVGNGKTTFNLPNQNKGLDNINDPALIPKYTYIMKVS